MQPKVVSDNVSIPRRQFSDTLLGINTKLPNEHVSFVSTSLCIEQSHHAIVPCGDDFDICYIVVDLVDLPALPCHIPSLDLEISKDLQCS